MDRGQQIALAEQFHALHHASEMLILPNVWDAGSAVIFERAGFGAVGTTSAGIAYALGYPDGQNISLSDLIDVQHKIVRRIAIPITIDLETGYGTSMNAIVENVRSVIEAGAVGFNFEDGDLNSKVALIPLDEQCGHIEALATLKAEMGIPFFINARTDVYLLGIGREEERLAMTLERGQAYVAAGADGVFVPGWLKPEIIHELVIAVDAPLNILALPPNPPIPELNELGVARLSLGSGPIRAVLGLAQKIAHDLHEHDSLADMFGFGIPYDETNRLFS